MGHVPEENDPLLRRLVTQQQALLSIARTLASRVSFERLAACVVGEIERVYSPDVTCLVLGEPGQEPDVFFAGPQSEAMTRVVDSVILDWAHSGEPFEVSRRNRRGDPGIHPALPDHLSVVRGTPVKAAQSSIGVLWVGFGDSPPWNGVDWDFFGVLAAQVAAAHAQRLPESTHDREGWLPVVLDRIPDPVIVVDRDLVIRLCNPAAMSVLGDGTAALNGRSLRELVEVSNLASLLSSAEADRLDYPAPEVAARDGLTFAPHVAAVSAEDGAIRGWVLVLRDISNFRRINASMSDFLGTVSHDLRSPLTFVRGYVDMLGMVGNLNERQVGFVNKISDGITQMADIVEKVLEAGKLDPETGNYQLVREPSDIAELVRQITGEFVEAAAKKRLGFRYTVADDVPIVNVDRAMLRSAFTNLIENAVKYTPNEGYIEIELRCDGRQILFRVTDNGYGIRPEDQVKLFERHVRVQRKEWKRVKGSGLGLFIVKNVARRHGGDAWVESEEGVGSSFSMTIPLAGANLAVPFG